MTKLRGRNHENQEAKTLVSVPEKCYRASEQRYWDAALEQLKKYHAQHGHTYMTKKKEDLVLWRWTRKENWNKQSGKMSQDLEHILRSLGFWDPPPPGFPERGAEDYDMSDDEDSLFERV
eukprot:CAMPEP_0178933136 /NCGR_PEP_ID=MMETSP0786-20121207/23081_1 /TAXON_ID=186022 /ORGANISM="Thalassionema frauenfeldii, Strain CCMP 1798" /LENGTH=119 /DNA_ID=CAMNT_0020610657 /DNA_START=84 /DNA_END=444 /DNA_ORIENTATION=+